MRICSFLPSATEILFALGLGDSVAGVTVECDFPQEAQEREVVVNTRLRQATDPAEIDRLVSESLSRGESLYRVEMDRLARIQPDLIITQDLCRVCAASPGDFGASLALLARPPAVLTLNPHTLEGVWNDILEVGRATERIQQAETLVAELRKRVSEVERSVAGAARPRVLCLEWPEPPFVAGHWVPGMVEHAGGADVMGRAGEPGYRTTWEKIFDAAPEVAVLMPCGYHLEQVVGEFRRMNLPPAWGELPAVKRGRALAVDASSYFSRPGPRLADGVEILGAAIHPERAAKSLPEGSLLRLY
jgi:iron complex transport system substrate-binding protein